MGAFDYVFFGFGRTAFAGHKEDGIMIRVLVVEDSVVQREILRRIIVADPAFSIVGEAHNGREAVRMVEDLRPDVVLMDIHMPDMNGVDATREIMRRFPVPIVIASATLKKHDIDLGLEALSAGAIAVIAKPDGAVLLNLEKISATLRSEIQSAARMRSRPAVALGSEKKREASRSRYRIPVNAVEAIGICASTGGPAVLNEILSALPRPFAIPILLVQHISPGFEGSFADWLSNRSGQPVRIASNGQTLSPGVWMAPGGTHLTLANGKCFSLLAPKAGDIHCPSGNPLFASLAKHLAPGPLVFS